MTPLQGEVPLNLLYTRVLEKKFIDSGIKNIEIISIGVGAWGTDQSLEVLKREGIKYKPDFVIYQFCENDLDNNLLPREDLSILIKMVFIIKNHLNMKFMKESLKNK